MRVAPQNSLAWKSLAWMALSAVAQGCLPGERANDPLPDVKVDAAKADAGKPDVKADVQTPDVADGGDDVTGTAEEVTATTDDAAAPGCKSDDDCAALPVLPCHEAPTCKVATGLCESVDSAVDTPCAADACFTGQLCDAKGECSGGTAIICDDKNGCTLNLCAAGVCVYPLGDLACTDKNACTVNDHCVQGASAPECVGSAIDCNDGNPCTLDKCNEISGACQNAPVGFDPTNKIACVGNPPGTEAVCDGSTCGHAQDCDDKNPCTDDNPNPVTGLCTHTSLPVDTSCNSDKCKPGTCHMVADLPTCVTKVQCDDLNPCTVDKCNTADGSCTHTPATDGAACTSSDPCVGSGACKKKNCLPTVPVVCSDGNPCTDDACTPMVGCTTTANSLTCNDGTACTVSDACAKGMCGGTAVNADDGNSCTIDACDPLSGVSHTPAPDGQSCGTSSTCSKGICVAK